MAALGANDDVAVEILPEFDFSRFAEEVLGGVTEADRLLLKSSTTTKPLHASSDDEHTTAGIRSHTERTPQPLQYTTWRWYSGIATNVALCLLTTPFLVLAITNAMLNFRTVRPSQLNEIQSLNKLATTIFPLVFSIIVGRTITKYAAWQLERGTRLETLEQLIGSRTVFGTYRTHFSLRSFNCLGLGLTLIWILSPLGGQSTSRLLSTRLHSSSTPTQIQCLETRGSLNLDYVSIIHGIGITDTSLVGALISGAFMAPTSVKQSNLDFLGNVKIPYMMNPDGAWSTYTSYMDSSLYSSIIGIPIFGLQPGKTTFSVESTHIKLDCTTLQSRELQSKQDDLHIFDTSKPLSNGTFYELTERNSPWAFGINQYPEDDKAWYEFQSETNANFSKASLIYNNETNIDFNRSTMLYQDSFLIFDEFSRKTNGTFARCDVLQIYVESRLSCEKANGIQNCSVVAQCHSQKPHINSNLTWLNTNCFSFATILPKILSTVEQEDYGSMQLYILRGDTDAMFNPDSPLQLSQMNSTLFARRLGQVLNAFGISNIAPTTFGSGGKKGPDNLTRAGTPVYQNITGILTTTKEVYSCSWIWLAMFLTATLSMLLMAILGAYYDLKTHTPEVLGYCSLLTRDSKYVTVAPGGNVLDGFDRARRFKDLRLRFGNVGIEALEAGKTDSDSSTLTVGHLAVADEDKTTRARKGQLYV
ncbi:hypothetical protein CJF32_00002567 [Rutstroemia sp. NJR-2017a WRK4]|nr:hypothetical protein CJF32_00007363 [Rutstroemia sp. NJR-2017a WRK4]PQE11752.1 hypothetical protein CJF32_00002567 [Rutstroemia sp. NJR-2017a WRK4]